MFTLYLCTHFSFFSLSIRWRCQIYFTIWFFFILFPLNLLAVGSCWSIKDRSTVFLQRHHSRLESSPDSQCHCLLVRRSITSLCFFPRLSLNWTGTAIGWFFVTWPWLKSNVSRSWYIKQCTPLGIYYSTWSKHGGKWHFITTLRTARKARMKTQRHIWSVTLAGCLMDTMDQRVLYWQDILAMQINNTNDLKVI